MLKRALKAASFRLFFALDRRGVHVLPRHYYTPIPDYGWLRKHPGAWTQRAPLTGVAWDLGKQVAWIETVCGPYYSEVAGLRAYAEILASDVGPGFGEIESQVLHCFVRAHAPRRVVEIGSGTSTACMVRAAALNVQEGRPGTEIVCVEPYPRQTFRTISNVRHIEQLCQTVPGEVFDLLGEGDLLFIDSSHAVKTGSDVIRIYLDIIPRLRPGVFVHIHDINLPFAYPRDALDAYFASQETALLLALLTHNPRLEVLSSLSALHYDRPRELAQTLLDYRPQPNHGSTGMGTGAPGHFPSSVWLQARSSGAPPATTPVTAPL